MNGKRDENEQDRKKLSLHPLDFEEALADLLRTEPPPKEETPGASEEPQRPRRKKNQDTDPKQQRES